MYALLVSLLLVLAPQAVPQAVPQDSLNVLSAGPGGEAPSRMLYGYLEKEAGAYFDLRRAAVAALDTAAAVERRQRQLKERFLAALGGLPERTPLNPRVVGTMQRDGYRVERIVYESRPDHHVPALLFLPEGSAPFPGVLLAAGHTENGKTWESYQRLAILMAKNGLAVLAIEPIGQGERLQLLDAQGRPVVTSSTLEHTLVGVGALLVGQTAMSYRLWDAMRGLDYLANRPDIDGERLGATGHSGGGTVTAHLMALDERVKAAAPSCYITSMEDLLATLGPQDAEQNVTGQIAFGMEHADFITMRAPRPTLILAATRDAFPIEGTWRSFREAKRIYGMMGYGERVDLFEYNTGHAIPRPQREAAVRFMRRWLLGKDDVVFEDDFPILTDEEAQVSRSGQILRDLEGRSVFDLLAARADELARRRAAAPRGREALLADVRRLLQVPGAARRAKVQPLGVLPRDGYTIEKLVFETEPGIWVPALLFSPDGATGALPLALYVNGEGKAADAGPGGAIERLVREGKRVLALDVRGMGETTPGRSITSWQPHIGPDHYEAFLSLMLDRPLLGQRVGDVLSVVDVMLADPRVDPAQVELVGVSTGGPVALHAAALDDRIARLTLRRSITSWAAVVKTPAGLNQLTNVVPGALAVYDLPELAATIAPRPVTIEASVRPSGEPVSQAILDRTYAPVATAYGRHGAARALVLQAAR